jgi:hypothetical protein
MRHLTSFPCPLGSSSMGNATSWDQAIRDEDLARVKRELEQSRARHRFEARSDEKFSINITLVGHPIDVEVPAFNITRGGCVGDLAKAVAFYCDAQLSPLKVYVTRVSHRGGVIWPAPPWETVIKSTGETHYYNRSTNKSITNSRNAWEQGSEIETTWYDIGVEDGATVRREEY